MSRFERAARLAAIAPDSPDLGDELAALLEGGQQAQSARLLTGVLDAPAAAAPEHSLAGQRLGACVLESPLGQGGTGSVWRAQREDGRYEGAVAFKLLHLSLLGRAGTERFRREATSSGGSRTRTSRTCSTPASRAGANRIW